MLFNLQFAVVYIVLYCMMRAVLCTASPESCSSVSSRRRKRLAKGSNKKYIKKEVSFFVRNVESKDR